MLPYDKAFPAAGNSADALPDRISIGGGSSSSSGAAPSAPADRPEVVQHGEQISEEAKPKSDDGDQELQRLPTKGEKLKAEAISLSHLLTHTPKNPYCETCQRAKMQAKAAPNRKAKNKTKNSSPDEGEEIPPKKFGDAITGDHFIAHDELDSAITGEKAALVLRCRSTDWISCYPTSGKGADEAETAMIDFQGSRDVIASFYSLSLIHI